MNRDKVFLTEGDRYLFGMGTHYEIYEKMERIRPSMRMASRVIILRYGHHVLRPCM